MGKGGRETKITRHPSSSPTPLVQAAHWQLEPKWHVGTARSTTLGGGVLNLPPTTMQFHSQCSYIHLYFKTSSLHCMSIPTHPPLLDETSSSRHLLTNGGKVAGTQTSKQGQAGKVGCDLTQTALPKHTTTGLHAQVTKCTCP